MSRQDDNEDAERALKWVVALMVAAMAAVLVCLFMWGWGAL